MSISIESLPFDLVHTIAVLLDVRSYVNLARSSRHLATLLNDQNAARQCLERNVPYNKDTTRILQKPDHNLARSTLSLINDQREAVRTCSPCSASTVAYGTQFLFNQGCLCYICDDEIRVLDTYHRSRAERILGGDALKAQMTIGLGPDDVPGDFLRQVTLLNYADDILVLLYEEPSGQGFWLLGWDISDDHNTTIIGPCNRLRFRRRLASKAKLFVRHNRDYIYFGSHSALREDGHHEWHIQGFNLTTGRSVSPKPLRLYDFVGCEIGSTACFEIHDGTFFALSNQTSFDTEEVDWTSCYHFVRLILDDASPDLKLRKVWRRQHHEGPINDAWNDMSLQRNEQTGELNIIEVRKEWLGSGSQSARTSYTTSLREASEGDLILDRPNYPSHDQLSRTLDECSRPSWVEKPPTRIPKFRHREQVTRSAANQDFIRAKTKHRSYNSQAHAFIDLVSDEIRIPHSVRPKDRIRLRVASRVPASPLIPNESSDSPAELRLRPQQSDHNDVPIPDSEEAFSETAISLWPPPDAPAELFDLLCPGGRAGSVHAVSDERSIVYMAGPPNPRYRNQRAIVMISFDPGWGHPGLKRWNGKCSSAQRPEQDLQLGIRPERFVPFSWPPVQQVGINSVIGCVEREVALRGPKKRCLNAGMGEEAESSAAASKRARFENGGADSMMDFSSEKRHGSGNAIGEKRLCSTEPAMYLRINRGFWLR